MIIKLNLPSELVTRAQTLVDEGRAPSLSFLVRLALENQLLDETGGETRTAGSLSGEKVATIEKIPALFTLPNKHTVTPLATPSFGEVNEFGLDSPRAALLWGQINRLLPAKAMLRVLLNAQSKNGGASVPFELFRTECARSARNLAILLRREDFSQGRLRDTHLSAGLPWNPKESSALNRFKHHTVGYVRKDGVKIGAGFALRFVNLVETDVLDERRGRMTKRSAIGLTQSGLNWATIKNPVLDGKKFMGDPFSEEETRFYAEQLRDHAVGEGLAVKRMIGWILAGKRDPKSLDASLRMSYRDAFKNRSFTPTVVATMRSGILSRMREMGMILSVRSGRRVRYEVTPLGFVTQEILDPL